MTELIKTMLADITRKITPNFKGEILVKITENKNYGDYTTNIAFSIAKILHKSPQAAAEELVKKLNNQKTNDFSKIEAKNGFINFFLSPECLAHQLKEVLKKKNKYGWANNPPSLKLRRAKKINIEFVSANPTGPLTIGNGRGGFYGDVLANVLETQGNEITREFYVNDRGGQISTLGRSIKKAQGENITDEELYKGDYIDELAGQVDNNLNVDEAGQKAANLILQNYIKPVLKKLGIKFDVWFSEKSLYPSSLKLRRASQNNYEKIMGNLMKSDFVYEKDGATWMKTSELGDNEDRVLIKSDSSETYFLSDILYHYGKFLTRKFDQAIDIWGADHHGYAPRLKSALRALNIPEENLKIIITQFVRLVSGGKEVKISKRAGTFITLDELVREVGLDVARFFFLMYSPNTHMDFDMELAKEGSAKNPVYYVQYAHARISSVLRKAKVPRLRASFAEAAAKAEQGFGGQANIKLLKTDAELNLVRKLVEYPEILSDISANYEVHRLPRYALELAREFHNFYEKERVITEDKNLTKARLVLISAIKITLGSALNLMGVKAPEKM